MRSSKNKTLHKTLSALSSNKSIKLCPYDKGNGIVIIDSSNYVSKVNQLLQDEQKFLKLESPSSINKHPICVDKGKLKHYLKINNIDGIMCNKAFNPNIKADQQM